ncbi:hypothetical protein M9Y10_002840 [Tritrichomonas musculus]|uniref:Non-specific serine/threonine protein kinase n=1 Tax=Tritrichomonas musculus TaxID=1915356 RepID=A0ABR2LBS2_9EUKA
MIYIFKDVLEKLIRGEYKEEIQTQFPKKFDFNKNYEDNFSIFDYFPRNSGVYREILLSLNEVSEHITEGVLDYLCLNSNLLIQIKHNTLPRNISKFLDTRYTGSGQPIFSKEHFFLLLLFTDLILLIIKTYGVPKNPQNLINLGFALASKYQEICINILLDQWSVIFSLISENHPDLIFQTMKSLTTKEIENRKRFFFSLLRYFRLDTPGFNSDEFIDYIKEIIEGCTTEKSSVYTSLSTLLITYRGDPRRLEFLYEDSIKYKDFPKKCPGALDLATMLMVILKKNDIDQIKEFCVNVVFPRATSQGMLPTAARIFRNYIWNFSLDPKWLFTGWSPELNNEYYDHLQKIDKKTNSQSFYIFEKYFLPSLSFDDCQSLLTEIIILLSSIDFKFIRKWFKSLYENYGISDDRNMTMIQALPSINNPAFSGGNSAMKKEIELFIEEFASRFFLEMYPKFDLDYAIHSDTRKKYKSIIIKSTDSIAEYNKNNHFDFGTQFNELSIFSTKSMQKELPYNELMEIMPSVVVGGLSDMKSLTEGFIVLSASRINKISRPMYQSCILLLKNPKSAYELIKRMIKIITSPRHDAMICNCLRLLKKSLDEPLDDILPANDPENEKKSKKKKVYSKDTFFHSIEFCAFIALTSENPFVRIIGFKLLIKVNRSLLNEGLYSLIDDHRDMIQLNVRNNIFTREYLKTPKKWKLHEEMFNLETCLRSKYQVPWLYFLAEFCRLILSSNTNCTNTLWREIASLASNIESKGGLKEGTISKSFHQGLIVVFATTAFDHKKLVSTSNKILINVPDEEKEKYCSNVLKIFEYYRLTESHNVFYAFRHLNYTIIPDLLYIIIEKYSFNISDDRYIQVIRTFYSMIRTLDESEVFNVNSKPFINDIFVKVKGLIMDINADLIKTTYDCQNEIRNYLTKKEREKKGIQEKTSDLIKNYKVVLRSFLLIIQSLLSKETIEYFYEHFGNDMYSIMNMIFLLLEKSKNHKVFKFIKKLSSDILIDIMKKQPLPKEYFKDFKSKSDYVHFLKVISKCELYKKRVLKVILIQNLDFLYYYILAYFRATVEFYPLYFSAIYEVIVKNQEEEEIDLNNVMYTDVLNNEKNKLWGYLFLLALFRMKTGGKRADSFLKRINLIYNLVFCTPKHKLKEFKKDCEECCEKVPKKYFGQRIAEYVVRAGQKELRSDKFSRSLEVMVDILVPFIELFQFFPNYDTCIPSQSEKKGDRLKKTKFLDNLIEITFSKTNAVNSYDKILTLWMVFLQQKTHLNLTFSYIFNYENPNFKSGFVHNKVVLLNSLMAKYPYHIIERLSQRCGFAFYAFCLYQDNKDFEAEFWIVDVLIEAIDMMFNPKNEELLEEMSHCMPIFIHYAILFHSNQTTKLLIKLCSKYNIRYSKMALSYDTLQRIVNDFQRICMCEPLKDLWKKEAMRWVVGCNKLKYSHTSLIILNALETEPQNDLPSESPIRSVSLASLSSTGINTSTHIFTKLKLKERKKKKNKVNNSSSKVSDNEYENNNSDNEDNNSNTNNNKNDEKVDIVNILNRDGFFDSMDDIIESDSESEDESDSDESNEDNLIVHLLKGTMKATAHFIQYDFKDNRNEVYEFIDDSFLLFNRHFEGNEDLCLDYLKAFLDTVLPVDAYFPEMNSLFESCFNSEKTSEKAKEILPNFFRPLVHVLESDSEAKISFERLVSEMALKGQSVIDIELVRAALDEDDTNNIKEDQKILLGVFPDELNRVLGHYASMIDNSSPELKKRIFDLSTIIVKKFQKSKELRKSKKLESSSSASNSNIMHKDNNSSVTTTTTTTTTTTPTKSDTNHETNSSAAKKGIKKGSQIKIEFESSKNQQGMPLIKHTTQIMSSEFELTAKNELNMQYVVHIFNSAVKSLPDNDEAMNFIITVNEINPLISTISFSEAPTISTQSIVRYLRMNGKQSNDIVTLTDCKKISSASNLIDLGNKLNIIQKNSDYKPSILPFSSELSLLYNPEQTTKTTFDKWALILKSIAGQILMKSIEKKKNEIKYTKLKPPVKFISDEKMMKIEPQPLLTPEQFVDLFKL